MKAQLLNSIWTTHKHRAKLNNKGQNEKEACNLVVLHNRNYTLSCFSVRKLLLEKKLILWRKHPINVRRAVQKLTLLNSHLCISVRQKCIVFLCWQNNSQFTIHIIHITSFLLLSQLTHTQKKIKLHIRVSYIWGPVKKVEKMDWYTRQSRQDRCISCVPK